MGSSRITCGKYTTWLCSLKAPSAPVNNRSESSQPTRSQGQGGWNSASKAVKLRYDCSSPESVSLNQAQGGSSQLVPNRALQADKDQRDRRQTDLSRRLSPRQPQYCQHCTATRDMSSELCRRFLKINQSGCKVWDLGSAEEQEFCLPVLYVGVFQKAVAAVSAVDSHLNLVLLLRVERQVPFTSGRCLFRVPKSFKNLQAPRQTRRQPLPPKFQPHSSHRPDCKNLHTSSCNKMFLNYEGAAVCKCWPPD